MLKVLYFKDLVDLSFDNNSLSRSTCSFMSWFNLAGLVSLIFLRDILRDLLVAKKPPFGVGVADLSVL